MGFRLQQKLMTLNFNLLLAMSVLTKRLWLESRGVRYKVALYFSYLQIKFDDEIKGNPFEFQAYVPICLCPKLNWRSNLALFAARFRSY